MKHLPIRPLIAATALAAAATAAATQPFPLPVSLRPTADEFGRLTVLNANNDAKQWQYDEDEQCIFYAYSSTKDADDWVFVPVELTAGHSWLKVSVEALATGASGWYDENFELALGESPDAASMRTVLEQTVDSDEFMLYGTEFPNSISGTAWLGIHATSPKNRRTLKVRDITLQSYSTPIPLAPAIKASATDGLCYTATVTMPSLTVQGSAIEGDLNLRFSIDGEEHETYAALAPGSDVAVEATLAKGEHTLAFVAVLATGARPPRARPQQRRRWPETSTRTTRSRSCSGLRDRRNSTNAAGPTPTATTPRGNSPRTAESLRSSTRTTAGTRPTTGSSSPPLTSARPTRRGFQSKPARKGHTPNRSRYGSDARPPQAQ